MSEREQHFDYWASTYDRSVTSSDAYPFAGYEDVLGCVITRANIGPEHRVIDVGIGTGNLSMRIAPTGCELWGVDFSSAMIERARLKLPDAHLLRSDLLDGLPDGLPSRFDRVISAYVLHHFDRTTKLRLIESLLDRLTEDGLMVIADIAFETMAQLEATRRAFTDIWDPSEHYWVAEEVLPILRSRAISATFEPVSVCGGLFTIRPGNRRSSRA